MYNVNINAQEIITAIAINTWRKEREIILRMNKTKRKIFEASMRLFAQKGYDATSVEEISPRARLNIIFEISKSLMKIKIKSIMNIINK